MVGLVGPATPAGATTPGGIITNFGYGLSPAKIVAGPDGNLWFTNTASSVGRITPAGTVSTFHDPSLRATGSITAGTDGNLWFSNYGGVGRITPGGTVTNFTAPGITGLTSPLVAGPDGNVWFANDWSTGTFGRITTAGVVTMFSSPGAKISAMTAGPDGNVWFTSLQDSTIGRISPAGVVDYFTDPSVIQPRAITTGSDGNLWIANQGSIDRLTPGGTFTVFTGAVSSFSALTLGPDGNVWAVAGGTIGSITPAGVITTFPLPSGTVAYDVVAGPDGNLWVTGTDGPVVENPIMSASSGAVGRVTTGGAATWFDGNGIRIPSALTKGPDGNMWFTNGDSIGRITAAGVTTIFPHPSIHSAVAITTGPDGNLWFTNHGTSGNAGRSLGRITPAGVVTEFTDARIVSPNGITTGPDGNLWFANGNSVGRMTPVGSLTLFTDPTVDSVFAITAGPDGNLWFTGRKTPGTDAVGRITPGGAITLFTDPSLSGPSSIIAGPDGNLWFTNTGGYGLPSSIGRVTTAGVVTAFSGHGIRMPWNITQGPDGNLWFDSVLNTVGRITPSGNIWVYTSDETVRWPGGIATGPDGNLWFTNMESRSIGTISTGSTAIASIQGTVRSGGTPLGGVKVVLYNDYPSWTIAAQTLTNPIGHYRFSVAAAGNYRVQFIDGSGNHQRTWFASQPTYASSTPISVEGGAIVTADQTMNTSTSRLVGRATNSSGTGVGGIQVSVYYGGSSGFIEAATTGPNGYYTIKDLPPGTYYVRFSDATNTFKAQWFDGKAVFANARAITVSSGDVVANAVLVAN